MLRNIVLAGMIGTGTVGCTKDSIDRERDSEVIENTAEITNFETDQILVYSDCDMLDDYGRALRMKGGGYKGFSLRDNGRTWKGQYQGRELTVACKPRDLRGEYDVVNLRGHTGDMAHLFNDVKGNMSDYTTLVLGGCESDGLVDNYRGSNVAVLGGDGVQNTANNNYLLLQLPKQLDESNNWAQMHDNLGRKSQAFRNNFVSPATYNH